MANNDIPEERNPTPLEIPTPSMYGGFETAIALALDQSSYQVTHPPRILSIGTGETGLLEHAAFSLYFTERGIPLQEYTAVDSSEDNLRFTRESLRGISAARVIGADARNLSKSVQGIYDIVIMGHPQCESGQKKEDWKSIFENTQRYMDANSRLIATAFWEAGHKAIQELLEETGYAVAYRGENPFPGIKVAQYRHNEDCRLNKHIVVATRNIL